MIMYVLAVSAIVLDQAVKWTIKHSMTLHQSIPVIKNFLHISYVTNTGMAFGMFPALSVVFKVVATLVVISIIVVERMGKINTRAEKIFFGMILGGAAGNLIDRYVFGKITDFVDFRVFPVFNVADSFIFVGATLLFIIYFRNRKKTAAAEGAGKPGDTPATPGRDGGIKQ